MVYIKIGENLFLKIITLTKILEKNLTILSNI